MNHMLTVRFICRRPEIDGERDPGTTVERGPFTRVQVNRDTVYANDGFHIRCIAKRDDERWIVEGDAGAAELNSVTVFAD